MLLLLLHGDAPFGWRGFALAALATFALCLFFNELAKAKLKRTNEKSTSKSGRYRKRVRKPGET